MKIIIEVTTENENAAAILETILDTGLDALDVSELPISYTIHETE